MEIAALVISICAMLVSIVTPIFEYIWNKKMNRNNLEAEYFREIYGDILYQDMPLSLGYIHFDGKYVTGTDKLIEVLRSLRTRSVYFKISDKQYYDKLIQTIQDLEDYIVSLPSEMTSGEFAAKYSIIIEKNDSIYECMSSKYTGE